MQRMCFRKMFSVDQNRLVRTREILTIALCFAIAAAPLSAGERKGTKYYLGMSCHFMLMAATAIAAEGVYVYPSIHHNVAATVSQQKHAGHGIFMDWDGIEAVLSEQELALLATPAQNEMEIVKLFVDKLSGVHPGDLDAAHPKWFPKARAASTFFRDNEGDYPDRGSCRHRSRILALILNHYGIEASLVIGKMKDPYDAEPIDDHMWVYVPSLDIVAETLDEGAIGTQKDYEDMCVEGTVRKVNIWEEFVAGIYY